MKLIDTQLILKLIEDIQYDDRYSNNNEVFTALETVRDCVFNLPTAYDVNSVVEELNYIEMKWDKSCPPPNEYGEPMCDLDCVECQVRRCRDVVKRGGIYEWITKEDVI